MSPTIAALNVLNDLVNVCRDLLKVALRRGRRDIAARLSIIASQLDATRTRLVQDGREYIDTAWSFIDAGRVAIRNYRMVLA